MPNNEALKWQVQPFTYISEPENSKIYKIASAPGKDTDKPPYVGGLLYSLGTLCVAKNLELTSCINRIMLISGW